MRKYKNIIALIIAFAMVLSVSASATDALYSALLPFGGAGRLLIPMLSASYEIDKVIPEKAEAEEAEKEEIADRGHFAYVVSANQRLNSESGLYYAELVLINETGCFTVQTVDDVENYNFLPVLTTERIGKIPALEGKFIQFDMRKTDKIQKLEPRRSAVQTSFSNADGFYLVNITDERNGVLSFYDTAQDIEVGKTQTKSMAYHDEGHALIHISDGDYAGAFLQKISRKEEKLFSGVGNAVIQVSERKIVRVFSFDGGFEV